MRNPAKIFCIGFNKTGTSSLAKLFEGLGYKVAQQYPGELLARNCSKGDYQPLFDFVRQEGQFFQDVPFSMMGVFIPLAEEFPDSKFILSIRDDASVWYTSLVEYHSALFGAGSVPTSEDLKSATYGHKGWLYELMKLLFDTPDHDLYNREILTGKYNQHIDEVKSYFDHQPERLLVINLKSEDAPDRISDFLGLEKRIKGIPHANSNQTILHKLYRRVFLNFKS
ncbi:MAG: hypothetical protein Salg2KO_06830 [Salibacteraceae bacterium]